MSWLLNVCVAFGIFVTDIRHASFYLCVLRYATVLIKCLQSCFPSGQTTRKFVGHTKDVMSVAFSADNRQIVSGSRDKTIKLWNTLGVCKYTIQVSCQLMLMSCEQQSVSIGQWNYILVDLSADLVLLWMRSWETVQIGVKRKCAAHRVISGNITFTRLSIQLCVMSSVAMP